MSKIGIIIAREYNTRVRKKSFLITTLLTPILLVGIVILTTVFALQNDSDHKKIAVIESESDLFKNALKNNDEYEFVYLEGVSLNDLKISFEDAGYYGILYLTPELISTPNAAQLISKRQPPIGLLNYINSSLKNEIEQQKLMTYNIQDLDKIMKEVNTSVSVQTIKIDDEGKTKETSTDIAMVLAYLGGFIMYFLVFLFGSMVMRGVLEEKTNRIVEVLISSVKPIQLMIGKIIGIALVGLTQFVIWIIFSVILLASVNAMTDKTDIKASEITQIIDTQDIMSPTLSTTTSSTQQTNDSSDDDLEIRNIINGALSQNWSQILFVYLFYFLGGYLLYASMFAAVGAAANSETDTQQFTTPITIPIILALIVAMGAISNPDSVIATWCSIIPFTSSIVMVARIPFEVPIWQLAVSMVLLVATIVGMMWLAAKIYKTGILMYGKKPSWKELWKWIKY